MSDEYLSFDEWKARGYMIKKGQKHVKRGANNIPLFHRAQVDKLPEQRAAIHRHNQWARDEEASERREYDWPDDDIPF